MDSICQLCYGFLITRGFPKYVLCSNCHQTYRNALIQIYNGRSIENYIVDFINALGIKISNDPDPSVRTKEFDLKFKEFLDSSKYPVKLQAEL